MESENIKVENITYKGKRIVDLPREELLEVVRLLFIQQEKNAEWQAHVAEFKRGIKEVIKAIC